MKTKFQRCTGVFSLSFHVKTFQKFTRKEKEVSPTLSQAPGWLESKAN